MGFRCRRMSLMESVCYIVFLTLMSSQSYVKTDGWRYVLIGMALFAITGMFAARRKNRL